MTDPAGSRNLIAETALKNLLDSRSLGAHVTLPKIEWPSIPKPPDPPLTDPAGSRNLIADTALKNLLDLCSLGAHVTLPKIEWPSIPKPPDPPPTPHNRAVPDSS